LIVCVFLSCNGSKCSSEHSDFQSWKENETKRDEFSFFLFSASFPTWWAVSLEQIDEFPCGNSKILFFGNEIEATLWRKLNTREKGQVLFFFFSFFRPTYLQKVF
jgi:hypothetical protein